ncbi:hypothetical protein F5Y08DRAFT_348803 [Xylaria arbuscula]|nr:hypothetical protein F5Y08DRAFT_348803 [Xylaria arbuscula]
MAGRNPSSSNPSPSGIPPSVREALFTLARANCSSSAKRRDIETEPGEASTSVKRPRPPLSLSVDEMDTSETLPNPRNPYLSGRKTDIATKSSKASTSVERPPAPPPPPVADEVDNFEELLSGPTVGNPFTIAEKTDIEMKSPPAFSVDEENKGEKMWFNLVQDLDLSVEQPILPRPFDLEPNKYTKEYLEVGLLVANEHLEDGWGKSKGKSVIPRRAKTALRVFYPITEHLDFSPRCYVGCCPSIAHYLIPRIINRDKVFFYAEFWDEMKRNCNRRIEDLTLDQIKNQMSSVIKEHTTINKLYPSPSNPLQAASAANRFLSWQHKIDLQDCQDIIAQIQRHGLVQLPQNLTPWLVNQVHLQFGTGQDLEEARHRLSRENLGCFLHLVAYSCYTFPAAMPLGERIVRSIKRALNLLSITALHAAAGPLGV